MPLFCRNVTLFTVKSSYGLYSALCIKLWLLESEPDEEDGWAIAKMGELNELNSLQLQ